jgi:phenylacetate-CoA ligase
VSVFKDLFYCLPSQVQRALGYRLRRAYHYGLYKEQRGTYEHYERLASHSKREWIFNQTKAIAEYAQEHNEFYADFYSKHRFDPESLIDFDDLKRIPIVTKRDFRNAGEQWFPSNAPQIKANTGGTSGEPLAFALSREILVKENVYIGKVFERLGCRERDARLVFRGVSHLGKRAWSFEPDQDAFVINLYEPLADIAERLQNLFSTEKIDYFHGYPSAIYQFALFCAREENVDLLKKARRHLRGVLLGSEYPAMVFRDTIEKVFGVPSISWYGHSEMVILAAENEARYVYRPFQSYGYCEAVPSIDGSSRLVGTSFYNRDTPFIRYDTGDSVNVLESDGGLLEAFSIANGRSGEYIVDRYGHLVSLTAFIFGRHHPAFDVADFVQVSQSGQGHATLHVTFSKTPADVQQYKLPELFDVSNIEIDFDLRLRAQPYRTTRGKVPLSIPADGAAN